MDEVGWVGFRTEPEWPDCGCVFRERGLRAWHFYEWKKRVRESEAAKFVEVQIAAPAEPVRATGARSSAIEIRLRAGRSLVVEPGFDASHLRALLSVLEPGA